MSDKADLSNILFSRETNNTFMQYPLDAPVLSKGFTYYWRVYGLDAIGATGTPSQIFSFQLDPGVIVATTHHDGAVTFLDVGKTPQHRIPTTVTIKIQNKGGATENNVSLIITDSGSELQKLSIPVILSGEEKMLEFLWTPAYSGSRVLKAKVTLQTTDDYPQNDAMEQIVAVAQGAGGSAIIGSLVDAEVIPGAYSKEIPIPALFQGPPPEKFTVRLSGVPSDLAAWLSCGAMWGPELLLTAADLQSKGLVLHIGAPEGTPIGQIPAALEVAYGTDLIPGRVPFRIRVVGPPTAGGDFEISPDKQELSLIPGQMPLPVVRFSVRRDDNLYPPLKLQIKDKPQNLYVNFPENRDEVEIRSSTDRVEASFFCTFDLPAGKYRCTFLAKGGGKEKEYVVTLEVKEGTAGSPATGSPSGTPTGPVTDGASIQSPVTGSTSTQPSTPYRPFIPSSPPPLPSVPEAGLPQKESLPRSSAAISTPRPPGRTYSVRVSAAPEGKPYSLTQNTYSRQTFSVEESKGEGLVLSQRETSFLNQKGSPLGETLSEALETPIQIGASSSKSWEEVLYLPPSVLARAAEDGTSSLIAVRALRGNTTSQTREDVSVEACLQISIPGASFSATLPMAWEGARVLLKASLIFESKGQTPVFRELVLQAKGGGKEGFHIPHVPSGPYELVVEKDRKILYTQPLQVKDGNAVDLDLAKGGKE
ncbi:MAG: hypothetical protein HYU64_13620 [Armatimonadetes bacterium]|nr:hypothetical protein [Armatimonadota bacterium]